MGKRILAVIALITLALFMAACNKQACYRDGNHKRKPPMPFALATSELTPVVALIAPY